MSALGQAAPSPEGPDTGSAKPARRKRIYHQLYFWVLVAIALGITFGLTFPEQAAQTKWLADFFIKLVKVVIAPTIFCTVVVGIANLGNLARAGGLALKTVLYFNVTTVFALGIGLVTINLLQPGVGLNITLDESAAAGTIQQVQETGGEGLTGFLLSLIPTTFFSAFTEGQLIQVLVLAILVACALSMMGERGKPAIRALDTMSHIMFGVIKIVMYAAPIGAFGGMAFTVGEYGEQVLGSLAYFMLSFYITCILFIGLVLGAVCRMTGFSLLKYIRFIRDELLIVLGTSSSESVLPRMLVKLEAAGAKKSVVGLTIPTGYSFNLDGTAIYMTMGAIFIAQVTGVEVSIWTQIGLLLFMLISSNGAAGVSGAGLVTLAASLAAFDDVIPLAGIALIVGIDRFMSEARALTNLTGNGIGTLAIARWNGELDRERLRYVLDNPNSVDMDALMKFDPHSEAETSGAVSTETASTEAASAQTASAEGGTDPAPPGDGGDRAGASAGHPKTG
ncbi:C4-dicarboxylate transporter DctA [Nocardiopsis ansamitocini]|uniref:C4-dicarboxylate transport protein n=1 Tax=Nocardiopsis ansamitocini TaxID=1670832 RepID=A0A9W6UHQ9_9ACTN|nr:C4-dicarboxylate transporter DctA [Nocardiopsis ansamitocini]GLU49141.1 C4-dicarboxylate transport protein [Nocardiopsis ansamitocini]